MIGYHSVPIIADAYMKGIRGYDVQAALDAMVASATYAPYGNLGAYMKLGYVPVDHDGEAASKTVEYAFDDWTHRSDGEVDGQRSGRCDLPKAVRLLAKQLQCRGWICGAAAGRWRLP